MKLHKEDLEKIETEILKELSPACYEYYYKNLEKGGSCGSVHRRTRERDRGSAISS